MIFEMSSYHEFKTRSKIYFSMPTLLSFMEKKNIFLCLKSGHKKYISAPSSDLFGKQNENLLPHTMSWRVKRVAKILVKNWKSCDGISKQQNHSEDVRPRACQYFYLKGLKRKAVNKLFRQMFTPESFFDPFIVSTTGKFLNS